MDLKISVLVFLIKLCTVLGDIQVGPYKLLIWNITSCSGTLGTQEIDIYLEKQPSGVQHVNIDGYIRNAVGPVGVEMTWSIFKKTGYVALFTIQTKRICDLLKTKETASMFPRVDNRCFMLKGPYHQVIADVNAANHAFLGNMMPYGKYNAKLNLKVGRKLILCKEFYYECIPI